MATPKNNSVIRAFSILGAFDDRHREMAASEVAARLGLTPATAHRFLLTLESVGAVTRTADGRFQLGMILAELGRRVAPHSVLADAAAEPVARLVAALQDTVHVAVLSDNKVVIVASQASSRALRITTQVGRQLHAHCTALGKVLLAGLDDEALAGYLATDPLVAVTDRTLTSEAALKRTLHRVRSQGYADDNGETEEGVRAFGVPIVGPGGSTVAALAVMGPTARLTDRNRAAFVRALQGGAEEISARLFPSPDAG